MLVLDHLNILKRPVRSNVPLGTSSPYGGNLLGGALVGLGMSISGACPGTVLVQLAQGIPSARAAGIGAVLGGIAYGSTPFAQASPSSSSTTEPIRSRSPKRSNHRKSKSKRNSALLTSPPPQLTTTTTTSPAPLIKRTTIPEATSLPHWAIYTILLAGILGITTLTASSYATSPPITPIQGGLAIGLAQFLSLILTSTPLGVSAAYTQLGQYVLRAADPSSSSSSKKDSLPKSIIFASGVIAGSIALTGLVPMGAYATVQIPHWQALLGGFVMVFGARLGCGCTSGHGLSGLGALSWASLISVGAMFGVGIGSRLVFEALA
jgi:uncharacterized membrane protein YedE/YeeE